MHHDAHRLLIATCACTALALSAMHARAADQVRPSEWPCYGRDSGGTRHSPLDAIHRENVQGLKVAWTFRTGELEHAKSTTLSNRITFEATPLVVDGVMYFTTATSRVFALRADTGEQIWTYNPEINLKLIFSEGASRGLSYWKARLDADSPRLFFGTLDARLIALDARSGKPCADFGTDGAIDLAAPLRAFRGLYAVTSPPAVIGDVVVVGSSIGDNGRFDTSPGVVRAFNARDGKLLWSWDPIPRTTDDPASESWKGPDALRTGAANVWSIISADPERGLVFLPTSCPSPDFYGGKRLGDNRFANSVVALRADSGKVAWHFQVVHHDIWDYDVAAQPVLLTLTRDGKETPAVAVGTKMGRVFVLHRDTGEPLVPVEERAVPRSDIPGEQSAATQPFSELPALGLHEAAPWGRNDAEMSEAKKLIDALRYEGDYTPPSLGGSLVAPGNVGGINWSGMTFDPRRQLLITNVNRVASAVRLIPRADYGTAGSGGSRLGEEFGPQSGTPFGMARRTLRLPTSRLPATKPPWGTLAAIDLATGKLRWEVPLGYMLDPKEEPKAIEWGSVNLGGAITTAGGLTFIAASLDGHLRAFDTETGRELWRGALPAGGQATPMTYQAGSQGKQFIAIAAGGHARLGSKLGDYVVAFSLP
jgi:quinoprotein glucose dehydrogenase